MTRAAWLAAGALLLGGCGGDGDGDAAGGGSRPVERLVLVTIDTLRHDDAMAAMPTLRALAGRGLDFTSFWAATASTQPTHATLFTGRPPWQHGVTRNGMVLSDDAETLAETLREEGWTTAAVVGAFPLEHRFGMAQGFDVYRDAFDRGRPPKVRSWGDIEPDWDHFYTLADRVADSAVSLLDTLGGERQFLWVHAFDPHSPYGDAAGDGGQQVRTKALTLGAQMGDPETMASLLALSRRRYLADLVALDRALARLVARLERDGDVTTHLVITADHGESFGDDGSFGHGDRLTPQQLHVPCVVVSPRVTPARRDDPAGTADLFPTLLELAGLPPRSPAGGRSLLAAPQGPSRAVGMRRTYDKQASDVRITGEIVKISGDRFFMVRGATLFAGDGESVEVVAGPDPGDPELLQTIRAAFTAFSAELGAASADELLDARTQRALEALGYTR